MARQKGMLNLSGNLEPLAGAPLDSRSITPTVADLYIASNWPYKYIGMKTTVIATGDTYRLVNLDVTQESSWVLDGGSGGQTIQVESMPLATESDLGKVLQYIGTTDLNYTNGYFYKCVYKNSSYLWEQQNVQPWTSYSDFTGATSQEAGSHGLVPAPTTEDISKFLKGDGTWATVPMPSFDYSNTSPEAMNFSTDEKVIGTWINGKPLYQKTVDCGALPNAGELLVDINVNNIEKVVDFNAICIDGIGQSIPIPNTICTSGEDIIYQINIFFNSSHKIRIVTGSNRTGYTGYVTIRYTKTTDTAVASGEKIVGQWIDGKPVYQKTYSLNTALPAANANPRAVEITLSGLSSIGIDTITDMSIIAKGQDYYANHWLNRGCGENLGAFIDVSRNLLKMYQKQTNDSNQFVVKACTIWYTKTTD